MAALALAKENTSLVIIAARIVIFVVPGSKPVYELRPNKYQNALIVLIAPKQYNHSLNAAGNKVSR